MTIASDFFVASPADALSAATGRLRSEWPAVQGTGVDPIKLADVLLALHGVTAPTQQELNAAIPDPINASSEEGPWIFGVADEAVRRLHGLSSDEIAHLAAALMAGRGWGRDGWRVADVVSLLTSLARLAARREEGKALYLMVAV